MDGYLIRLSDFGQISPLTVLQVSAFGSMLGEIITFRPGSQPHICVGALCDFWKCSFLSAEYLNLEFCK